MRFSVYQSPVFLLFLGASFADLLLLTGASATKDELVVHLKSGSVRGGSQKSIFGLNLEYFLGIPYAAAPVGDLRFSPPQPVQPWEGVRDGTNYGARCPQNEDSFPRNTTVGMLKSFLNKFENAAFLLRSQWPTVKNNPSRSRKRSFLKTFFKPKELKTVALRFGVDREDLRSGAFRKRWYHDDHMSFKHKSDLANWPVIVAFQILKTFNAFSPAAFRVKMPFSNYSNVVWTGPDVYSNSIPLILLLQKTYSMVIHELQWTAQPTMSRRRPWGWSRVRDSRTNAWPALISWELLRDMWDHIGIRLPFPRYFSFQPNSHSLGRIFVSPQAYSQFESKMALASLATSLANIGLHCRLRTG